MTGDFADWVRIGVGAAMLLVACLVRDVVVRRAEASTVNEALRSRR